RPDLCGGGSGNWPSYHDCVIGVFMQNVILKGFILVQDMDLDTVKLELPLHCELTRKEPGCLVFEVTPNESNQNRFDVYEEFSSKAAFEAHQARVKSSRWGQVTTNVERHYDIVE
ncbi:putative quinol monooxygenase, partial [Marinobacterium sedimentorum]|uniref:putative quinol monooxygenase n=1 Tax=Marinobacterium sedimentorum TaxID=2927804 RepID=UPI0020C6917B